MKQLFLTLLLAAQLGFAQPVPQSFTPAKSGASSLTGSNVLTTSCKAL